MILAKVAIIPVFAPAAYSGLTLNNSNERRQYAIILLQLFNLTPIARLHEITTAPPFNVEGDDGFLLVGLGFMHDDNCLSVRFDCGDQSVAVFDVMFH